MSDFAACVLGASLIIASVIRAAFPSSPINVKLSEWSSLVRVENREPIEKKEEDW
jgi:hypothetical protein